MEPNVTKNLPSLDIARALPVTELPILMAAGADNQQLLTVSLAYLVLEAVRSTARFVTGLNWAQPKKKS